MHCFSAIFIILHVCTCNTDLYRQTDMMNTVGHPSLVIAFKLLIIFYNQMLKLKWIVVHIKY